ncbi:MAG TPA: S8 family serine peptidase [Pilimelia sp.]|nr:S8 family serine peptidase [Pilimelia sp.]
MIPHSRDRGTPRRGARRRLAPLAVLAVLLPAAVAAAPAAAAAPAGAPPAYRPFEKPARTALTDGDSRAHLHVKFAEGTGVRLRGGRLVAPAADLASVRAVLRRSAGDVARLFRQPEQELRDLTAAAAERSGRVQADLNLWYRVRLVPGADMASVLDALNALPQVEIAVAEPLPAPLPGAPATAAATAAAPAAGSRTTVRAHTAAAAVAAAARPTPDYVPRQRYRGATDGIDADYAATVPGGTGRNVRVHDIEYGWTRGHEDLTKLARPEALVPNGTVKMSDHNHGTAVMGEMISDANSFGVTGLVKDAQPQMTNAINERGLDLANAVITATKALRPGDVMLLEQQMRGCANQYVAVEWNPAVYDAIVAATSSGVTVVEAAGNGGVSLDASCNGSPFPRGKPDSGAIIVGAGGAAAAQGCSRPRERLNFSTHGSRVNLQAWGECVVSTGYGNLQNGPATSQYTARFSGTSSASPIVTAAAAAVSSIAKERGRTLRPAEIRELLIRTGTPQAGGNGSNHIGPLPNLRAAIAALDG